jgi:hypothetical protein
MTWSGATAFRCFFERQRGGEFGKASEQAAYDHALGFSAAHGFRELEDSPAGATRKTVECLSDQLLHSGGENVGIEELRGFRLGQFLQGGEVDDEVFRSIEDGLARLAALEGLHELGEIGGMRSSEAVLLNGFVGVGGTKVLRHRVANDPCKTHPLAFRDAFEGFLVLLRDTDRKPFDRFPLGRLTTIFHGTPLRTKVVK